MSNYDDLYNPRPFGSNWQGDSRFDTPKTQALYAFLDTEANNRSRVVGLSIEPDGVFIYTNSDEWCDDAGAGTFRGDSESAAIRRFRELVQPAAELYADEPSPALAAPVEEVPGDLDREVAHVSCPACNAEAAPVILGELGSLTWARCRACGHAHPVNRPDEEPRKALDLTEQLARLGTYLERAEAAPDRESQLVHLECVRDLAASLAIEVRA